jgi:hypothetical protein
MSKSPSGTRVRLVCTSCKTLCEVFIPGLSPSTKAVRYQVRCPNCKAINEPQKLSGSAKAADPKRKVCLVPSTNHRGGLHLSARRTCAGSAACSTRSQAAECFRVSRVRVAEALPSKLRCRTASS